MFADILLDIWFVKKKVGASNLIEHFISNKNKWWNETCSQLEDGMAMKQRTISCHILRANAEITSASAKAWYIRVCWCGIFASFIFENQIKCISRYAFALIRREKLYWYFGRKKVTLLGSIHECREWETKIDNEKCHNLSCDHRSSFMRVM